MPRHRRFEESMIDQRRSQQQKGNGTGLLIHTQWRKHIFKIYKHEGRGIAIDLIFKGKNHFKIICIYTPANKANKQAHTLLHQWISHQLQMATNLNYHTIFMEDFNTYTTANLDTNSKNTKPPSNTIKLLQHLNYLDTYRTLYLNTIEHTWSNETSSSRVDYIWISPSLISQLINVRVKQSEA